MAQVKFYRVASQNLSSIQVSDGNLLFTTDTGEVYIDVSNQRLPIRKYGISYNTSTNKLEIVGNGNDAEITLPLSTTSLDGLMSSSDNTKLTNIESGAQVNIIESIKVNDTAQTITNKSVNITVPTETDDLINNSGFITNAVDDLTYYYTKTEIDNKVASVYKYRGTVATYGDLPSTGLTVGDVYNVETDGSNYAWTGTEWDKLGGTVDLSNYVTNTDYASSSKGGVIKGNINGVGITGNGEPACGVKTYSEYGSLSNSYFIGKGTLDNVLTAVVGDINTAIDTINGEVI